MKITIDDQKLSYSQRLKTPAVNTGTVEEKRTEIVEYFKQTFDLDADLYHSLMASEDSFYKTADPLRHPLIFYYGHTATFFINKMILMKMIDERVNPSLESICAVGVDEMSWDDLNEEHYNWPTVAEVKEYRAQVREKIIDYIENKLQLRLPICWKDPAWIVLMCCEHCRIHLETSSVLIRQLPLDLVNPSPNWRICKETGNPPMNRLIAVDGGDITIGDSKDKPNYYGWDNEYGEAKFQIEPFMASQCLVSNREFYEFIESGGYVTQHYWTAEGWQWRCYKKQILPLFWRRGENRGEFRLRVLAEEIDMPWDWPVEVNYHEAKAFCNWLTEQTGRPIRLPTESEWFLLKNTEFPEVNYPEWSKSPGNVDLAFYASSCPVNKFKQGRFFDLIGNAWQWTETAFNGFAGFQVHPAYDDFSLPTFDSKHNMIKGGCWISTGNEAKTTSRYAFRRHFYQHAGFRYVESHQMPKQDSIFYETDLLLSQFLEFHFGKPYFIKESFHKTLVDHALKALEGNGKTKALDLGCATGRVAFELTKSFEEVIGVDFSTRFIRSASNLQEHHRIRYSVVEEGDLVQFREIGLADIGLTDEQVKKVWFIQGDACNLKPHLTGFDLIVASNILDRLYDPARFLTTIHTRVNQGGILVVCSPYTWSEAHTEKEKWLGGFKKDAENVTGLRAMEDILLKNFQQVGHPIDMEFVIRETKRKFQHCVTEITIWRKVSE